MKSHNVIVVFVFGFLAMQPVLAQDMKESGVVLRGLDMRCKTSTYRLGPIRSIDFVSLMMEFENKGSETVILINPTLAYGTGLTEVEFSFSDYDPESGKPWQGKITKKFEGRKAAFEQMTRSFDGERPAENFTIMLAPGEKFKFADGFA